MRLAICGCLCYWGTHFLAYTINFENLLLNAVAMEYIINIDELLFNALSPSRVKVVLGKT